MSLWAVNRDGLTLELPSEDALRDLIGKSGIEASSHIVIVNRIDTDFSRADSTRVAWTCSYAGIQNTAILDGGYNRWVKEIKPTSTEISNAKPGVYTGKTNPTVLASKAYVLGKLGRSVIVDTRLPEDYFGIASKPGHIKNSVNLPTPWAFANDGTLRKVEDLQAMAFGVIGENKSKEVILYCGVGGYASTWWFLLSQLFGYQNVKVYDGSMEEWVKDSQSPVTAYCWH
jgi:thiosulfate/3-mercaptopyruvate sulfurtransferase